jgi:serine/threonine protein kinase
MTMPVPLDCPEFECWLTLDGGSVPPEQRTAYERHLETCPACQERLDRADRCGEALRRLARQLGDPTTAPPDRTLTQFLERLHEGQSPLRAAPGEPADLSFLVPADRPGVLGTLGSYEVAEVIGRGGMGIVLKAFDSALDRHVAIKVMSPALAVSATARRRFIREAQAAAAVCHDHVVTVHGVAEAEGLPYLVMPYVPGESLQERLDRTGPLPVEEVLRIGLQAASGLAAAHAQGLIHRDIKPANLLLEDGLAKVKLTDFGLARLADDVGLTRSGVVAGTPEYMAPEQARGEPVDHRADLFALGSVLYACCTGGPPFRGASAVAVLHQVTDQAPLPLREQNPEVPAWLEAIILRLLAKSPAERFQSAAEVAALLESCLAHLRQPATVLAPQVPTDRRSRRSGHTPPPRLVSRLVRPLWPAVLLLLAASGLGITAWLAAGGGGALPPGTNAQEYSHSFKDNPGAQEGWDLFGADAGECVKFEPAGLRITLPAGYPPERPSIGVMRRAAVKGDFEITVGYEILQEPEPADTVKQTRFSLGVSLDRPNWSMATFSRTMTNNGPRHLAWVTLWDEAAGKNQQKAHGIPAEAKAGRLRLVRTGSLLAYLASEGGEDFTHVQDFAFGAEDLSDVRLVGSTGGPRAALDVRVTDCCIRAASLPGVPAAAPAAAGGRHGSLVALAVLFGIVVLAAAGFFARRRLAGKRTVPGPLPAALGNPAAPALFVSFPCPGCGKALKAKAELAGKKVKCRHCGQPVVVPRAAETPAPAGWRRWGAFLALSLAVGAGLAVWVAVAHSSHRGAAPGTGPAVSYLDQTLGVEPLPGIEEEGFLNAETSRTTGEPFRWTNGAARLVVPLAQPPVALFVRLGVTNARPVRLGIRVNGEALFQEQVAMQLEWARTFDLAGRSLGKEMVIEILSDTEVPAQVRKDTTDSRALGVCLRGVMLLSRHRDYLNVPLGIQSVPGVPDDGFYYFERPAGKVCRWTNGSATLTVPLRGKRPKALALTLELPSLPNYRVQVAVNGRKLWEEEFQSSRGGRPWSAEVPLDGVPLGDSAVIELTSSTFVPSQVQPGIKDDRTLGVRVRRLVLVDDSPAGSR